MNTGADTPESDAVADSLALAGYVVGIAALMLILTHFFPATEFYAATLAAPSTITNGTGIERPAPSVVRTEERFLRTTCGSHGAKVRTDPVDILVTHGRNDTAGESTVILHGYRVWCADGAHFLSKQP